MVIWVLSKTLEYSKLALQKMTWLLCSDNVIRGGLRKEYINTRVASRDLTKIGTIPHAMIYVQLSIESKAFNMIFFKNIEYDMLKKVI